MGVEGQESGSVVIRIEHPLDGPPRELDNLQEREISSQARSHAVGWTHSGVATRLECIARSGDGGVD